MSVCTPSGYIQKMDDLHVAVQHHAALCAVSATHLIPTQTQQTY